MITRRRWSDLSQGQQAMVLSLASIELALTAAALGDLVERPSDQIRGSKPAWALALLAQPIGPIAYLVWGARRPSSDVAAHA